MSTEEQASSTPAPQLIPNVVTHDHGSLEARKAFNSALAAAQGGFGTIVKNRSVKIQSAKGDYAFRYADLEEIHAKTRPSLSANGLATTGQMFPGEEGVNLVVVLMHAAGFERISEVFVKYGEDIKQFGGKLTYMRRYILQNLLDVAADDDADEQDDGVGNRDFDTGSQRAPAPAPAPRTSPARKSASKPAAGSAQPPEPPPEGEERPPASESQPERDTSGDTKVIDQAEVKKIIDRAHDNQPEPVGRSPNPEDRQPQGQAPEGDPGDLAEEGERNFLIKRLARCCKPGEGIETMRKLLAENNFRPINPETLESLTRTEWTRLKGLV